MKKKFFVFYLCLFLFACSMQLAAQTGMTVSPGKLYFKLPAGASATQKIVVSNPNEKELEIGVSVSDWNYDSLGNSMTYDAGILETSCADWVQVMPGSYFTLQPHEKRELNVVFTVPANAEGKEIPVHNAMLFLTQLNPGNVKTENGTSIKVTVRMGIKLYHSFTQVEERDLDIVNLQDGIDSSTHTGYLEMAFKNTGKIWLEGKIKWELLNTQTGEKKKLDDQDIFSLPGDMRLIRQDLPKDLKKGKYIATAVINYGNKDELKVVELEFAH
jgi:P pilus assembly chaperone PapD